MQNYFNNFVFCFKNYSELSLVVKKNVKCCIKKSASRKYFKASQHATSQQLV